MSEVKASVKSEPDPKVAGRTTYEVSGPNPAVVQHAITLLMEAETLMCAEFTHPKKMEGDVWVALGYTIKEEVPSHA